MTTEQLNIIVPALTTIGGAVIGAGISYLVGRQQFKATVVSANRQIWINTLRDTVSEYQASVVGMTVFLTVTDLRETIKSSEFCERFERSRFLGAKIKLLINPFEKDHQQLVEIVTKLESIKAEPSHEELGRMLSFQTELTEVTQKIVKDEWKRVKRGK